MRIFVISLKSATARRTNVARQLDGLGLAYQFFDAVTGTDALGHFSGVDSTLYRLNTRREPMANEMACYASHLALWKLCVELQEPIVILEDDCHFNPNFPDALRSTGRLIDRFGFLRLQSHERPRRKRTSLAARTITEDAGFSVAYLSDVPLCLVAYAISPAAAGHLVRSSGTLTAPVDKFLQRTWDHDTPIFVLAPASVTTAAHVNESTIGKRSRKSWDPALLLRRLLYKATGEIHRYRFDRQHLGRFLSAD